MIESACARASRGPFPNRARRSLTAGARVAELERELSEPRTPDRQATATGIFPIFACHSLGPVMCADVPPESTATVTGMSTTSNS